MQIYAVHKLDFSETTQSCCCWAFTKTWLFEMNVSSIQFVDGMSWYTREKKS